jgi:uncharacterized membrane protein (DUF373 family)
MLKAIDFIEKILVRALIVFMLLAITLGTIELGRVLIVEMLSPPFLLLDLESLFEAFGLVLVILIGMELLRSMKMFLDEEHIRAELVIEVAVIAICNKIITLDLKKTTREVLVGVAALLIGLSAGYVVLRRLRQK